MKIIQNFAYFSICLFSFVFANAFETNLKQKNINVLLQKDSNEALLEVRGAYYIFNPEDGSKIGSGILGKRFMVRPTATGVRWGEEFPGVHQIVIVPRSEGAKLLLNGIQYEGAIGIFKVGEKINIINEIDVESYIKSTLNTQFEFPLEAEAMAAIAIAARTTAYFQITNNTSLFWHVDAKQINYQGASLIIPDSATSRAVDATKNLILVNQKTDNTSPFFASWNEHCGGKTAAFKNVFRKDMNAPQEGVDSPLAALDRKDSRWSYSISIESFSSRFNLKKISSIDLFQDNSSNKVYAIRVKEDDRNTDINFFALQEALGKNLIKSNDFIVFMRDKEIHFVGYGKGHGVGLCLYSASCMAQNGDMAMKILSKFFPNTFIVNLSATSLLDKTSKN